MMFRRQRMSMALLVWVLVCATLLLQSAFFSAPHSHTGAASQCCAICHAGQLPVLQPVVLSGVLPQLRITWLFNSEGPRCERDALVAAGLSRAPPFSC